MPDFFEGFYNLCLPLVQFFASPLNKSQGVGAWYKASFPETDYWHRSTTKIKWKDFLRLLKQRLRLLSYMILSTYYGLSQLNQKSD